MILPSIIIALWFWAITATWLAVLWKAKSKQASKTIAELRLQRHLSWEEYMTEIVGDPAWEITTSAVPTQAPLIALQKEAEAELKASKQSNKGNYMTALLAIIMVSMAFLALSHP